MNDAPFLAGHSTNTSLVIPVFWKVGRDMGTVKTMANRKLEVVRRRLQREIERLGIDISIHRQEYVSDGSNGYS